MLSSVSVLIDIIFNLVRQKQKYLSKNNNYSKKRRNIYRDPGVAFYSIGVSFLIILLFFALRLPFMLSFRWGTNLSLHVQATCAALRNHALPQPIPSLFSFSSSTFCHCRGDSSCWLAAANFICHKKQQKRLGNSMRNISSGVSFPLTNCQGATVFTVYQSIGVRDVLRAVPRNGRR